MFFQIRDDSFDEFEEDWTDDENLFQINDEDDDDDISGPDDSSDDEEFNDQDSDLDFDIVFIEIGSSSTPRLCSKPSANGASTSSSVAVNRPPIPPSAPVAIVSSSPSSSRSDPINIQRQSSSDDNYSVSASPDPSTFYTADDIRRNLEMYENDMKAAAAVKQANDEWAKIRHHEKDCDQCEAQIQKWIEDQRKKNLEHGSTYADSSCSSNGSNDEDLVCPKKPPQNKRVKLTDKVDKISYNICEEEEKNQNELGAEIEAWKAKNPDDGRHYGGMEDDEKSESQEEKDED